MSPARYNRFRQALGEESDFPLTDSLYDYIVRHASPVIFEKGCRVVDIDSYDPDVYLIVEGILRGYMLDNGVETNVYFGMEGTFVASMQSFSAGSRAIMCIEACCQTELLRIRKPVFDAMMAESIEFARWVAGVFIRRSCFAELKAKMMSGDARWRYEWLEKCRPELLDNVPLKAIASYLSMTEVHVSRIRKQIARGEKFRD